MADSSTLTSLDEIEELTPELRTWVEQASGAGPAPRRKLNELFQGTALEDLRRNGFTFSLSSNGRRQFLAADTDDEGNVLAVAAAVPRTDGKSQDFLKQISDFQTPAGDASQNTQAHVDLINLFHQIAKSEGTINNAIQKSAALIATRGDFKVRGVRGQPGKGGNSVSQKLYRILSFWKENLNARPLDAVMTGARGVSAWINAGARLALIEGDHICREVWKEVEIPNLGTFSLPMNLTTFSSRDIVIPVGAEGTDIELLYWKPASSFVQTLLNPQDKNLKPYIQKLYGTDVLSQLKKNGQYLLTPELMHHIKNRPNGVNSFGESVIECVMPDLRYKRALDALEIVSIENLINRIVIVRVGSDNPNSVYHKQAVTSSRLSLLQRMFQQVGPSMTILWPGPDLEVVEVGAFDSLLDISDRYAVAEKRIRTSLGVPSVLLTGEGTDGKAVGYASSIGLAAQLQELQDQYATHLRGIAEKIAAENGFLDVDVIWEFDEPLLNNKTEEIATQLQAYQLGLVDVRTVLEKMGLDPDVITKRMADEVAAGWRTEVFGPPSVTLTSNPTGNGGQDGGRPPTSRTGKPDPRQNKETQTPVENK